MRAEIEATRAAYADVSRMLAAARPDQAPRRVMHHDCKLNNLLLDAQTGEALCVIDLDTVMQGSVLSDFGELVRTATSRSPEDEPRLETIAFDLGLFEALARGYAAGARDWLGEAEGRLLPLAGPTLGADERDPLPRRLTSRETSTSAFTAKARIWTATAPSCGSRR